MLATALALCQSLGQMLHGEGLGGRHGHDTGCMGCGLCRPWRLRNRRVGLNITISVQAHFEAKRHHQEMAVKMAQDDRAQHLASAKPGTAIPPLAVYVAYYVELLRAVSENTLTPEKALEIGNTNQALFKAIQDAQKAAAHAG